MNAIEELTNSGDQFKAICFSNHHIRESDKDRLTQMSECPDNNHVLEFEHGWRIKLRDHGSGKNRKQLQDCLPDLSQECYELLATALEAGYRMVELDCDATVYESFPVFEW